MTTRSRAGIGRSEAVEQRRLAGLGAAGDEDVEPGGDGGLEEPRGLRGQRAEPDQVVEVGAPGRTNLRMFTDQCRRVMSGITTCSREPSGSIASTNGVDRSTRRPEDFSIFSHEVAHLVRGEDRGGQLVQAAPGDEDLASAR